MEIGALLVTRVIYDIVVVATAEYSIPRSVKKPQSYLYKNNIYLLHGHVHLGILNSCVFTPTAYTGRSLYLKIKFTI